eukprot:7753987-Pyramimonas_sp.AAC.1
MRHGAASHASAVDRMPQSALQERMRHGSAQSTLRYKKHVRYLKLLELVPSAIQQWTTRVERLLGPLLLGQERPPTPPFRIQTERMSTTKGALKFGSQWMHQWFLEAGFGTGSIARAVDPRGLYGAIWVKGGVCDLPIVRQRLLGWNSA